MWIVIHQWIVRAAAVTLVLAGPWTRMVAM